MFGEQVPIRRIVDAIKAMALTTRSMSEMVTFRQQPHTPTIQGVIECKLGLSFLGEKATITINKHASRTVQSAVDFARNPIQLRASFRGADDPGVDRQGPMLGDVKVVANRGRQLRVPTELREQSVGSFPADLFAVPRQSTPWKAPPFESLVREFDEQRTHGSPL